MTCASLVIGLACLAISAVGYTQRDWIGATFCAVMGAANLYFVFH